MDTRRVEKGSGVFGGHEDREEEIWDRGESGNNDVMYSASEKDSKDGENVDVEEVLKESRRSKEEGSEENKRCGKGTNGEVTGSDERNTEGIDEDINWDEDDKQGKPPRRRRGRQRGKGNNKPSPPLRSAKNDWSHYRDHDDLGLANSWIVLSGVLIQLEDNIWSQIKGIRTYCFSMRRKRESLREK